MSDLRFFCLPDALVEVVDIAELRLEWTSGSAGTAERRLFSGDSEPLRILRVPFGTSDSLCGSEGPEDEEAMLAFTCLDVEEPMFALSVASLSGCRRVGGRGGIAYCRSISSPKPRTKD